MSDYAMVRDILTRMVPFAVHVGIEIVEVGDGYAITRLPADERLHNPMGSQHAGAIFTVAESATSAALAGALANHLEEVTALVTLAKIEYRRSANGAIVARARLTDDDLACVRRVPAGDKTEVTVEVALHDERSGAKLATASLRWYLRAV
jgi:uncharacterized protein (TIGR00369 family)